MSTLTQIGRSYFVFSHDVSHCWWIYNPSFLTRTNVILQCSKNVSLSHNSAHASVYLIGKYSTTTKMSFILHAHPRNIPAYTSLSASQIRSLSYPSPYESTMIPCTMNATVIVFMRFHLVSKQRGILRNVPCLDKRTTKVARHPSADFIQLTNGSCKLWKQLG